MKMRIKRMMKMRMIKGIREEDDEQTCLSVHIFIGHN